MSRVRFATARALYETFPKALTRIDAEPTDDEPIEFLRELVRRKAWDDAVSFCAHLLPRREVVWWACTSVRMLCDDMPEHAAGIEAAEAWVHAPDTEHRQAAQEVGMRGPQNDPMAWLALAAAWSGGTVTVSPSKSIAAPPHLTAQAARVAVLLAARALEPAPRDARLDTCITDGMQLAETGL
jgi:hypothetical protein